MEGKQVNIEDVDVVTLIQEIGHLRQEKNGLKEQIEFLKEKLESKKEIEKIYWRFRKILAPALSLCTYLIHGTAPNIVSRAQRIIDAHKDLEEECGSKPLKFNVFDPEIAKTYREE